MNNFKSKIDQLRDTLVGVTPNPSDQINQITYALIYKFMNDIDDESVELGGQRSYFAGEFAKYAWHELMRPRLEARQRADLYREAIEKMSKNPGLPTLFQEIYKNAFLPFNNPATLDMFLKQIDKGFNHGDTEHNDDIGDAYEYLLQITGAQGNIGQFRTPRHIIKFIVDCVQPKATDTILDPAVGTAGFLIAAYNFIKSEHDGFGDNGTKNDETKLSADAKARLHRNFRGFDIDPTMVRTAQVNMYLHGFKTPAILSHDTLTSTDFWDDRYDVVLANPPFMTPKGGIQPHKKFGVSANRAEVLFVDYIASHLKPHGRAGFIVPEGIIFQSGKAYKQLRQNLVENSLYAVISLPSGVFQPYSGVKTSILLLDPELAKSRSDILFVKIESDGLSLGAQRRPIAKNDLPKALEIISCFQKIGKITVENDDNLAQLVPRSEIAENDYILDGGRYATNETISTQYETTTLGELEKDGKIEFLRGQGISKKDVIENGKYKAIHYGELYTLYSPVIKEVVSQTNFDGKIKSKAGDVLVPATTTADAMGIAVARSIHEGGVVLGGDINIIRTSNKFINADFLSWSINGPMKKQLATYAKGVNILHLSNTDLRKLRIVFPPLEIQQKIVAEIENKQAAIDHAREIIKTLERERAYFDPRPRAIREGWPMRRLGEITDVRDGTHDSPKFYNEGYPLVTSKNIKAGKIDFSDTKFISRSDYDAINKRSGIDDGDIIMPMIGTIGGAVRVRKSCKFAIKNVALIKPLSNSEISFDYLVNILNSNITNDCFVALSTGATQKFVALGQIRNLEIHIPPLEAQKEYTAAFAAEQKIVFSAKSLIELMEGKINSTLAEIWND